VVRRVIPRGGWVSGRARSALARGDRVENGHAETGDPKKEYGQAEEIVARNARRETGDHAAF
jgi:hypothetical protein